MHVGALAATTGVQDALREMCNIALRAWSAFTSWYVELVNKVPKDEGVVKINRLRPLKFLDVTRKLVVGIVKDRRGVPRETYSDAEHRPNAWIRHCRDVGERRGLATHGSSTRCQTVLQ